ncbi:MAG: VWA domain-containing protein [Planctomycetes bacterium]|nr:VWA domain-containing protein [Planctomycetota bacterium]
MLTWRKLILSLTLAFFTLGAAGAQEPTKKQPRPTVEVVFCLDTTGSMSGLIHAAKQKIWAISNQISAGNPTPLVKVGLVAYRDRRDAYVTKVFDLTDDLDAIHGQLMGLKAVGGGDFPESVNQALHEAVTKISWSKDKKTLRMIFLVGDAPPHMDYPDDVKYPITCKLAVERNIIINTVQCGTHAATRKYWLDICKSAEGSYVQIDAQGGPVVTVATPFDAKLAAINLEINKTQLVFGGRRIQEAAKLRLAKSGALPAAAQADRAAFTARNNAAVAYDLLQKVKDGKVKLEDLKKDELPEELKGKSLAEQKAVLASIEKRRAELSKEAIDLDKKRGAYINKKLAENQKAGARDGFDNQVLRILQTQAERVNIQYGANPKKK